MCVKCEELWEWIIQLALPEEKLPDRTSLLKGPIDLGGGSAWDWSRYRLLRVAVMKDGSAGENLVREASGHNNVVVFRWLIRCDEHWIRLSNMDINGGIGCLYCVSPLNFDQFHVVALNPEVETVLKSHVWNSKPVCFPCLFKIQNAHQHQKVHVVCWMHDF